MCCGNPQVLINFMLIAVASTIWPWGGVCDLTVKEYLNNFRESDSF